MTSVDELSKLYKLVQYNILTSTTAAGTGHPSSSLSATEVMTAIFFGGFLHYDLDNPSYSLNDRVIFSKGHAAPLLYSLYQVAGVITQEELLGLRTFNSVLEGHPTPRFKYIDVATGSLGQGLSVGLGMALGIKRTVIRAKESGKDIKREPIVWVLLGDSEMAEGQVWEAMQVAAHYKLNNLVGVLDMNRLGQRGETMLGWDLETYKKRAESFGWEVVTLEDGHDLAAIQEALSTSLTSKDKPVMIIAKTKKGHGIKLLENLDNWHGKPLPKDKLESSLNDIGEVDIKLTGTIAKPAKINLSSVEVVSFLDPFFAKDALIATREAYGSALLALNRTDENMVVLDAETSNSTFAESIKTTATDKFYEMYIAEQNMVSAGVGLSKVGYKPFISSFAAFFTRAFDQIRMAQYSEPNIKIVGSHAGVSIGQDGSSQMALEDIAMMRSVLNSIVLYPSDAVSAFKLFEQASYKKGIVYVRTTREKTPILYSNSEVFEIGGSKVLYESDKDTAVIFTAGITLHEAIKSYKSLLQEGINVAIVDLYSIKPLDRDTIMRLSEKVKNVIVIEDHYPAGGIGEAVKMILPTGITFVHLAVNKIPRSGTPAELLRYEEIDAQAITEAVKKLI